MKEKKEAKKNQHIAIVRVRGEVGIFPKIKSTLKLLRIHRKNYCVVVPNSPDFLGMIKRVKDYVTFGEINEDTFSELLSKRGKVAGNKPLNDDYLKKHAKTDLKKLASDIFNSNKSLKDIPGAKPFFRLKPPTGGFERKGIKHPYSVGGALGYRGKEINTLIKKML
jgi:large subunit ribosomal protein L30